jgi:acyl-CoA thioesterase-1
MQRIFTSLIVALLLVGCASLEQPTTNGQIPFPTEIQVPAVGSVTIKQLTTAGRELPIEEMFVKEHIAGRPIFAGKVLSYNGKMTQTQNEAVVWTDDCSIPLEVALPPQIPNMCDWVLCYPPKIGETYVRPMKFFVSLMACSLREGVLTVRSIAQTTLPIFGDVVHTEAKLVIVGLPSITWQSYVKVGIGEVLGRSQDWSTVYQDTPMRKSVPWQKPLETVAKKLSVIPSASVVAPAMSQSCDIIAFGDSLTQGMGAKSHEAYPVMLGKIIHSTGMSVCNHGRSGEDTKHALLRVDEVIAKEPKIVILAFGANDALRGVDPAAIEANLKQLVERLRAAGIKVLLGGFIPPQGLDLPEELHVRGPIYQRTAEWADIPLIPWFLEGVHPEKSLISADGLHPNAAGYQEMAKMIAPHVLKLIAVTVSKI